MSRQSTGQLMNKSLASFMTGWSECVVPAVSLSRNWPTFPVFLLIKRIETQRDKDISLAVLIRLLRAMTQMEGIGVLVPEVPESPFLSLKDGKTAQRVSSKRKRI